MKTRFFQFLKDYSKCVWANKFTLAGFASSLLFVVAIIASRYGIIDCTKIPFLLSYMFLASFGLLFFTRFGLYTLEAYCKAKQLCQRGRGRLLKTKMLAYCHKVGMELVMKENQKI